MASNPVEKGAIIGVPHGATSIYPTYSDLPSPAAFGVGVAQVADTGNIYLNKLSKFRNVGLQSTFFKTVDYPALQLMPTSGDANKLAPTITTSTADTQIGGYGHDMGQTTYGPTNKVVFNVIAGGGLLDLSSTGIGIAVKSQISTPGNFSCCFACEFNGTEIEFQIASAATSVTSSWFLIDGKLAQASSIDTTLVSGYLWIKLTFTTAIKRRIELFGNQLTLVTVRTNPTGNVCPAQKIGPKTIVLGDSWCAQGDSWPTWMARTLGWTDVWCSGVGGTGFVNRNNGLQNYLDRLTLDVINQNPDLVILWGSGNDSDIAATTAAMTTCINNIRSGTNALIIFVPALGGSYGLDIQPANYDLSQAEIATAISLGVPVINLASIPLQGTPYTTTLPEAYSAGSPCLTFSTRMRPGMVISVGSGATKEFLTVVGSMLVTPGNITTHFTTNTVYAHSVGEPVSEVTTGIITGSGNDSAPTWVTGTVTNGVQNIAVTNSAVFTVGQMVAIGNTLGNFVYGQDVKYFISSKPDATHVTLANYYNKWSGSFTTITPSASGALTFGIPGNRSLYFNNTSHPNLAGNKFIGESIAAKIHELFSTM